MSTTPRTAYNDYAAEIADAKAEAEALYDARQMRYGENVPSAQELAGER